MSPKIVENADRWKPAFWRIVQTSADANGTKSEVSRPAVPVLETTPVPQAPDPEVVLARKMEEARQQGIAEGMAKVQLSAAAQTAVVIEKLSAGIAELDRHRERITAEATHEMVQLATSIASRILSRELHVDPEAVAGLVKGALAKIKPRDLQRVRLHAAHAPQVRAALGRLSNGSSIEIVVDPIAQLGDVFFETSHGGIDASAWTQLREIARGLTDRSKVG